MVLDYTGSSPSRERGITLTVWEIDCRGTLSRIFKVTGISMSCTQGLITTSGVVT